MTDRSFVLVVPPEPVWIRPLRFELSRRLSETLPTDDEAVFVAALLVRQAQSWRGAHGRVSLRTAVLGPVVHFEATRGINGSAPGPACPEAFHALVDALHEHTQRFTVSTFAGSLSLSAQKVVQPLAEEVAIDLALTA
jgi:hypothetical protein